jgi:shikimate dehydrogenase
MGWPIAQSKSPRLHGFWLSQAGIDGTYVPLPVRPETLGQALRALPVLGFRGVNLTMPHKEIALELVDFVDPLARRIGALNTIVVREDGKLEGLNTDAFGFSEHLRLSGYENAARPATILGAGGAARAVIAALQDMGCPEIRLVNRTVPRAQKCAAQLRIPGDQRSILRVYAWDDMPIALSGSSLLINTTSLGMVGQPPLTVHLAPLPIDAWVYDIITAPLETALLQSAKARGHRTVDGIGMLLHQGRPGFKAWFGIDPVVTDALRDFVLGVL